MDDVLKKKGLKMALDLIGKDNISSMLKELFKTISNYEQSIELEENEKYVAGLLLMNKDELYYITITISNNNEIVRMLTPTKISDLINNALNKI